jgi:phosphate transport system substrate-binding protein
MIGRYKMRNALFASLVACLLMMLNGCEDIASAARRDQIRVVGSTTVYPFATAVAERFVNDNADRKSPIIEQNGTGPGVKSFCGGIGAQFPDIVNASRRLKAGEYALCAANGVTQIGEIQIGLDGMAFAENASGPALKLTLASLYKALAATPFGQPQTARLWRDVDPALPAIPIKIYGPPASSGTRDALAELIMMRGCDTDPAMLKLRADRPKDHAVLCTTIREDGLFIEAGENDTLIVQKLGGDANAIGIFGFSFLEANGDRLHGNSIDGVAPSYASIADFSYPGARPLYIYVKMAHLNAVQGLRDYIAEFGRAWGPDAYLRRRGMVVAPAPVLRQSAAQIANMQPLDPAQLK